MYFDEEVQDYKDRRRLAVHGRKFVKGVKILELAFWGNLYH